MELLICLWMLERAHMRSTVQVILFIAGLVGLT